MSLFQLGYFRLHSGLASAWKIECDALTDEDWDALAFMAFEALPHRFREVIGVPQGGLRLAAALREFAAPDGGVLIVDDVLTTGKSMEDLRAKHPGAAGLVVFARGYCASWITPLFRMPGA